MSVLLRLGDHMDGDALRTERDEVLARLEKRWTWCTEHPDHPKYQEREELALADLKSYEDLEDALEVQSA